MKTSTFNYILVSNSTFVNYRWVFFFVIYKKNFSLFFPSIFHQIIIFARVNPIYLHLLFHMPHSQITLNLCFFCFWLKSFSFFSNRRPNQSTLRKRLRYLLSSNSVLNFKVHIHQSFSNLFFLPLKTPAHAKLKKKTVEKSFSHLFYQWKCYKRCFNGLVATNSN